MPQPTNARLAWFNGNPFGSGSRVAAAYRLMMGFSREAPPSENHMSVYSATAEASGQRLVKRGV